MKNEKCADTMQAAYLHAYIQMYVHVCMYAFMYLNKLNHFTINNLLYVSKCMSKCEN